MEHNNLGWDVPINAHRQSREEVRAWYGVVNLEDEHEHVQESGTVIARKAGRG